MKAFRFLWQFARSYARPLIATMLSMLCLVAVQLVAPWIVRRMVTIVRELESNTDFAEVTRLAAAALGVYAARGLFTFLRSYMAHVAGWNVVADARSYVYEHLQKLSLRFYDNRQTGQIMSRVVNDSDKIETLIAHAIPDIIVNILMLIGVYTVLSFLNWKLALLCLIPVPLIVFAMKGFSRHVRPAFRKRQEELGELNAILQDNLSGIREIKAFSREPAEANRIRYRILQYKDSLLRALRLMATFQPLVEFSSSIGTILLIYFGGRLALREVLALEDLVAFFLYLELFYQPVRMLSMAWEHIQEALSGAERVAELLDETPEVHQLANPTHLSTPIQGEIVFDSVSFEYVPDNPVLRDVCITIPAGNLVALVGPTGVGKTTIASLVPRFYDPNEGRILLDGVDLRDLDLAELRSQISIVLQDVFLFHGTVRDNIAFGRPAATEAQIVAAAEVANADEFIQELPDGYDTMVGERGVKLSGGQKQRVSIARAVLADKPILILDEATSSVDARTERLIQDALQRLMAGRTTIVIAHRLSTIKAADAICVLKEGRVVETGVHDELMDTDGEYRRLYEQYRTV